MMNESDGFELFHNGVICFDVFVLGLSSLYPSSFEFFKRLERNIVSEMGKESRRNSPHIGIWVLL